MFRVFFDNWKKICIGILAGIVSGLFATGGGMILVPAFMHILKMKDVEARATSVACILPLVVVSGIFYYKSNYINWNSGILCAIGGCVGGFLGAKILKRVPDYILKIMFLIFILYYSYRMLFL